jgi:hypothetical protein
MFKLRVLIATFTLALTLGSANANTITTFDISGVTAFIPAPGTVIHGSFPGTLQVDVTSGTVLAASLGNHAALQLFVALNCARVKLSASTSSARFCHSSAILSQFALSAPVRA